jgi:hypothetical protein
MKIGRGTEVLGGNLPQRHFVHHKSHMTRPGFEPGPPRLGLFMYKKVTKLLRGLMVPQGAARGLHAVIAVSSKSADTWIYQQWCLCRQIS